MSWQITLKLKASKEINKLDGISQNRIKSFLKRLKEQENPRNQGKPLTGKYKGLWRYRVGDYRLICNIQDEEVIILVLNIGHRKNIYK
ncbi:MAG: type II toxin-antitoxin system RelE/ParE family toxin [Chlorobi bacterium]|nr:type II toxin-antitoxin system RelE/ParE family toxin [Chlorobiota bacterium]